MKDQPGVSVWQKGLIVFVAFGVIAAVILSQQIKQDYYDYVCASPISPTLFWVGNAAISIPLFFGGVTLLFASKGHLTNLLGAIILLAVSFFGTPLSSFSSKQVDGEYVPSWCLNE